jgi:hypothetical protein
MNRNLLALILSITLVAVSAGHAQAPAAADDKNVLALIKEVQAQQAQIIDNQTKIEAKLAEIAESLRVARIFTSREK